MIHIFLTAYIRPPTYLLQTCLHTLLNKASAHSSPDVDQSAPSVYLLLTHSPPTNATPSQVKVMWPRGDVTSGPGGDMTASRRTKNAGLSGFVSFMKRKDAEAALRELDGFDWGGSILRVGWSKAVPVAAKPLYGMVLSSL
jgi:hypothetical protein